MLQPAEFHLNISALNKLKILFSNGANNQIRYRNSYKVEICEINTSKNKRLCHQEEKWLKNHGNESKTRTK